MSGRGWSATELWGVSGPLVPLSLATGSQTEAQEGTTIWGGVKEEGEGLSKSSPLLLANEEAR